MDLLKHGESAYPADAWVEQQYMQDFSMEVREDWEMLNFWKSFVNGFTYNQVGQIFFLFIFSYILKLGKTSKEQKTVLMCFSLCLVLTSSLSLKQAMGVT